MLSDNLIKAAAGAAGGESTPVSELFSATRYTGTGGYRNVDIGLDLADNDGLVWIKSRGTKDHCLFDTVRGTNKRLRSSTDDSELQVPNSLQAFGANGFDLGGNADVNDSGEQYISWTFLKSRHFFDVVKFTGTGVAQTIPHELGSTPGMLVIKNTDNAGLWVTGHESIGLGSGRLFLDRTNESSAGSAGAYWNSTAATSSNFTVGGDGNVNNNGDEYIAYLFGNNGETIKAGSYVGNDSTNNIDVGFEPQFVLIKSTGPNSGNWVMLDNQRGPDRLYANDSSAEGSDTAWGGFSTTGFTLNNALPDYNLAGSTYAYVAIAAKLGFPYEVGEYYPMFAVAALDANTVDIPAANCEIPMRRALAFDTANTSPLYGDESDADVADILASDKYTCNPDFGSGGAKISGIKIRHVDINGSLESGGEASFEFDNTNFNIYDDACNQRAISCPVGPTGMLSATRACGNISNVYLEGHSGGTPAVYLNQSTYSGAAGGGGLATVQGWSEDNGDYTFIQVGLSYHGDGVDNLDTLISPQDSPGLAFGISDSDGMGGLNGLPWEGIGRRSTYPSLVTNNLVKSGNTHSGNTTTGYFIVYGKYLSP